MTDRAKDTNRVGCERVATREPHVPHLYKTTSASGWLYDAQCPGVATCGASSPHDAHDAAFANPGEASHCNGWPPAGITTPCANPDCTRGYHEPESCDPPSNAKATEDAAPDIVQRLVEAQVQKNRGLIRTSLVPVGWYLYQDAANIITELRVENARLRSTVTDLRARIGGTNG